MDKIDSEDRVECGQCDKEIDIEDALIGVGFEPVCSEECRKAWNQSRTVQESS